jgi:uncharacterized protein YegP (UPF0339 family)
MGTFEPVVNSAGDFEFRLLSGTGKVLAVSGTYSGKDSAVAAIALVRESAAMALIKDRTTDPPQPAAPPAGPRYRQGAPSRWFG